MLLLLLLLLLPLRDQVYDDTPATPRASARTLPLPNICLQDTPGYRCRFRVSI